MRRRLLTRRDLLLSGGALALSGMAGTLAANRAPNGGGDYDAIVVGAGTAGIAAARTIRAAGASVLVLEATNRIGGRIAGGVLTGVSRERSDLHALVTGSGFSTIAAASIRTPWTRGDRAAFTATYAAMLTALVERAERLLDDSARDENAYDAVRGFRNRGGFREAFALLGLRCAHPAASLLDYHRVANRAASPFVFPADDTLLVSAGLPNVLKHLAGDIPIALDVRVASIDYRGRGATLRTATGQTYRSRRAIVTASTSMLASESIAFSPALPSKTAAAVAALPMGVFGGVASSYATVGSAAAREALAQPVDGALWFAGEATAPRGFGCVEGAWESGAAAARAALTA